MTEAILKKIGKLFLYILGAALFLYICYLLSDIILIMIISVLLAFIFEPFVKVLEKEGVSRLFSTLIVFVIVGLLTYLLISFIVPKLYVQMDQLIQTLKVYSIHDQIVQIEVEIYKLLPLFEIGELSRRIESFIASQMEISFESITNLVSSIVTVVAILVIVPFITFFLLKDSQRILQGILNIMPNNYFEMSYWILKKVSIQLGRFVRAWIFDATFVGFTCGLGFYFIGIENALPLGVIAGLGHLVPYLGPIIGGVPALIISIMQFGDLSKLPLIVLLLTGVYAVDNGFVQPYVFAKSVDMHPIIIILLIIAGSQLFGILGMLLAVPTAAVIKTAAKEIYFAFKNYRIAKM